MGLCAGIYIDVSTTLEVKFVFFNLCCHADCASFNYNFERTHVLKTLTDVECCLKILLVEFDQM